MAQTKVKMRTSIVHFLQICLLVFSSTREVCGVHVIDEKGVATDIRPGNFTGAEKSVYLVHKRNGERDFRIVYRGRVAMETTAFLGTEYEMKYTRLTDGYRLVQSVKQTGDLKDCQYTENATLVNEFMAAFFQFDVDAPVVPMAHVQLAYSQEGLGAVRANFRRKRELKDFKPLLMLGRAIKQCRRFIREERRREKTMTMGERKIKWNIDGSMVAHSVMNKLPQTPLKANNALPSGASRSHNWRTGEYGDPRQLGKGEGRGVDYTQNHTDDDDRRVSHKNKLAHLHKKSKMKHTKKKSVLKKTKKKSHKSKFAPGSTENSLPGMEVKSRSRRSYFNRFLMFPGTKWCGRGQIAQEYDELGEDQEADVCCREHDCCDRVIYSFDYKYNYFNYRLHAILHCDCDKRFRGCLLQSVSPMANLIGRIYFNIMGSKCFVLTNQRVCVSRTWWGSCRQYEEQSVASLQDQEPYNYCSTT